MAGMCEWCVGKGRAELYATPPNSMVVGRSLRVSGLSRINFTKSLPQHRTFAMASATLPKDRRPIIISGPSGVGKGTLYHMLQGAHPNAFQTSISHTTRGPRPGEADKVDYYFVTMQEFEDLIAQEGFVEHAKFGGNRYGTSKLMIEDLQKEGKIVILDIEMEGVKQIKNTNLDARFVFIAPPKFEELEKRLRGRGTETEESIAKRLAQAKAELEYSKVDGVHDKIIVNDDVEKAFKELREFVFN